jgi:translation initiation factor 2B subunit (eIF-2B alpha/beta/delta family)
MKDQDVTTVLLGASSLFSNGSMLAPAGTAMVNNSNNNNKTKC